MIHVYEKTDNFTTWFVEFDYEKARELEGYHDFPEPDSLTVISVEDENGNKYGELPACIDEDDLLNSI